MSGPLDGCRIIEIAGIGPGPFAAMLLADMGAEVVRIDRPQSVRPGDQRPNLDVLLRNRCSAAIDLKHPDGVEAVLSLVGRADALLEGFRPGVMERLGLGPDVCLARNPALVYGRMTGWGQEGPLARRAGHDIDYIALAGALAHFARDGEAPVPPMNLVGDFGGGGMFLAFGTVCAMLEARRSGRGQVVDAAMIDGTAALMAMFRGFAAMGLFDESRPGRNLLDTGAHFYDVYRCSDGRWLAIGAIEPQFYAELLDRLGLADDASLAPQMDAASWPGMKDRIASVIATRTRDDWAAVFADSDACVAPVLTMGEAPSHPHHVARGTFTEVGGVVQHAPAPRFSRTSPSQPTPPARAGEHTREILSSWGVDDAAIGALLASGAAVQA